MSSESEIVESTFAEIDEYLRDASIAQVGGFRPPEEPVSSWFGGCFVALPDETWPANENGPMIPLLQVRTDELPHLSHALSDVALFNVFVDRKELPGNGARSGEGWVLRSYRKLKGLAPVTAPKDSTLRSFPIRWTLAKGEGPTWADAWGLHDLEEFNELDDCEELFEDRYQQHTGTKIGGWPSFIQSSMGDPDRFVFQIGSEQKPGWMWGDNGNAYVFREKKGDWLLVWDSY